MFGLLTLLTPVAGLLPPALAADPTESISLNFMKVKGIEGGTADAGRPVWIDVLSFSYGLSQVAGALQAEPLTITKHLDKASPQLMRRMKAVPTAFARENEGQASVAPFPELRHAAQR